MIRPRKKTDRSVTGGFHKKSSRKTGNLSSSHVKGLDCRYFVAFLFHLECVVIQLKVYILFGPYDPFFFGILELLVGTWRLFGFICNFLDNFTDPGVFSPTDISLCPNANFARSISSENRTILNKRHFTSHSGTGYGCPHSGIATANDDQVVFLFERFFGNPQKLTAPSG